jgi:hypothetical protein
MSNDSSGNGIVKFLIGAAAVAFIGKLLFGSSNEKDIRRKRIFISFAIEDSEYRDHLVTQARNERSPFDFIDMSVKEPYKSEWKRKCRTKIKSCDGVIVLLSKNIHQSSGARWEMKCAKEEGISLAGMHIKKNDKGAIPPELKGKKVIKWTWENLAQLIEQM